MSESMGIWLAYTIFGACSIAAFWTLPARTAAALCFFAGWLFLPVAYYPASTMTETYFTVDVIGAVVPSNLGLTKAALVPVIVLVLVSVRAPGLWRTLDFRWPDALVVLFCLCPLPSVLAAGGGLAEALWQTAYLCAVWLGSWLTGRVAFSGADGNDLLIRAAGWSGVALLPVAVLEGTLSAVFYQNIYGNHAFLLEGADRYFGFRPLGFFEHGNQYGIWMAVSALSLAWLSRREEIGRTKYRLLSLCVVAACLASQSVGAIALLMVGLVVIYLRRSTIRRWFPRVLLASAALGAVYFSGVLPVERFATSTGLGQKVVAIVRASGRSSLGYRVRRDQMSLPLIAKAPVLGHGTWDWWRPLGSHPWGLPLLLAGQFGIPALLVLIIAFITPALLRFGGNSSRQTLLALVVLIAMVDAVLNSYLYAPALLASGAIFAALPKRRTVKTNQEADHEYA